jgi:hypothetical protein
MAATLIIEEEFGTYVGSVHPHNGYYAGDFSNSWSSREQVEHTHQGGWQPTVEAEHPAIGLDVR